MKIVYCGFDLFYPCLEYLINAGHEVLQVFTCDVDGVFETNSRVCALANSRNIPVTTAPADALSLARLLSDGCELLVSAGYYYRIPVIDGLMQVNLHPAMLPIGRGPWPQPVTILKRLPETGVTLHKIAAGFDSGDIVLQQHLPVYRRENLETLTQKQVKTAVQLLASFLQNPAPLYRNARPQGEGEYWREPSLDEMTFSLADGFNKIDSITRAFYGFRCFLRLPDKTLSINKALCRPKNGEISSPFLQRFDFNDGCLYILKWLDKTK